MNKIKTIQTSDYVGMSATLPLEDGVTTVVGPNAGGKTMLINVVPGILYNEAKLSSGASCGFTWESESGTGSMYVSKQGNKTTWRGTLNNEAKLHNTIKPAQTWLRENFPVSYSAFTTANFLAAFRSMTMLGGSPAARMQLLADIIDLRVFDDLKKSISKLADSARVTVALRDRIKAELDDIDAHSGSKRTIYLGGMTEYLAKRRSDIRSRAMALAEALEDRPFGNVPDDVLKQLKDLAPARNKAWDLWEEANRLNAFNVVKPKNSSYIAALALRDISDMGDDAIQHIVNVGLSINNGKKHRARLAKVKAEAASLREQLEHLAGHDGDTCPTCNSKIDSKVLRRALRSELDKLTAIIKSHTKKTLIAEMTDSITAILERHKTTLKDVRLTLAFDYEKVIADYETAEKIEARFGGKLPEKPEKARIDLVEVQNEIRLRKRGYRTVDEDSILYNKLAAKYDSSSGVLSAVTRLVEEQADRNSAFKRRNALIEELEQLPHVEDAELLVYLLKALDNRNARNPYLELVSEHLIEKMNEIAPAFFSYKMEFAWQQGKLIANRKGSATDAVSLSGREGRTFMLLNAVAVQCCLPPAKRLSTLFLDELEAGSSPENRSLLAELIPTMLDYYDNICVVTPLAKSEFYIEGPRYRVVETKDFKKSLVREE